MINISNVMNACIGYILAEIIISIFELLILKGVKKWLNH